MYTIYIMYIRGFDLASDTQTGCYLRGLDLTQSAFGMIVRNFCLSVNSVKYYCFSLLFVNFTLSYGEQPRFSCPFSGKKQRFS